MAIDYTNIDEVINDLQLMIDDSSYDKAAHIYQLRLLALQGLRELTFDVEQSIKTAEVVVNSTSLQVTLPADYVSLKRIGFKGSDGLFHPLGLSDNLSLDSTVLSQGGGGGSVADEPYYQTNLGKKFGVGGGNNRNGYYRINRNDNTINLSSNLSGKGLFIEYLSDGVTSTPAMEHVVRFSINVNAKEDKFGIKGGVSINIPKNSGGFVSFTFKNSLETPIEELISDPLNTDVYVNLSTSSISDIADALSTVINEGHPSYHVAPYDENMKASQIGADVTVIISNISASVDSLMSTSLKTNVDKSNYHAATSQEELQIGVVGDEPRIHKFCEEALRSYVYYKYIQRKRGIPANEKMMAKKSYFNEKRMAVARMMNFSKEEALQTGRKGFKQSPKS